VQQTMMGSNALNERGQRILIVPDTLVVPPALMNTALAIINSQLVAGSANNDVNTLQGLFRVVANPYLSDDATAWFTLDTASGALLCIDSGEPVIETGMTPDGQNVSIKVWSYFGIAPWMHQAMYACDKATS